MTTILLGALVISEDDSLYDVAILLMSTLQKYCQYHHYEHPNKVDPYQKLDFMVVSQVETLQRLYAHYQQLQQDMPPIIHLQNPKLLQSVDYATQFPHLQVIAIPQEPINDFGGTLKFDSFYQAIKRFREQAKLPKVDTAALIASPPLISQNTVSPVSTEESIPPTITLKEPLSHD